MKDIGENMSKTKRASQSQKRVTSRNDFMWDQYKNILMINPPVYDFLDNISRKDVYFNRGLLTIATILKKEGKKITLIDFPHETVVEINKKRTNKITFSRNFIRIGPSQKEIGKRISLLPKPDIIFISSTYTFFHKIVDNTITTCKAIYPNIPIVLGGIYPTLCLSEAKKSKADILFLGRFTDDIVNQLDYSLLSSLPKKARLLNARGCPSNCNFCAVSMLEGKNMIFRDPDLIIADIKILKERYGFKEFSFFSDNFLINHKKNFGKILDGIIREKLNIKIDLSYGISFNLLTEELVKKFKKAGVIDGFSFAIETFNSSFRNNKLGKNILTRDLIDKINLIRKYKYRDIGCHIIICLPDQTLKDILNSCLEAWSLGCKIFIYPFTPIPGTKLYNDYFNLIKDKSLLELNGWFFPMSSRKLRPEMLYEIFHFCNEIYRKPEDILNMDNSVSPLVPMFKELILQGREETNP